MEGFHPIQLFNTSGIEIPILETDAIFLLNAVSKHFEVDFELVEVVYVDEAEIQRINTEYLKHEYVTDIITFRLDEQQTDSTIEGTIYCCAQRIFEQAEEFDQQPRTEFLRVLIHGLIHLNGYNDQTPEEKKEMTRLEDHFLDLIDN
ncbi:MAG: rRNA maturation RNase YbeY [Balneolaceae bacterium]|nr:rRNA maturation RNase YbeY [Balneolaceae bacterium]